VKAALLARDAPAWAAFLEKAPHDFYHLPSYVSLCAVEENGEATALLVEDDGCALLVPLIVRPIGAGLRDAVSPYGYPGPLVRAPRANEQFVDDAWAAARALLAAQGLVSVFVRGHPVLGRGLPSSAGTVVQHGQTVSVDLTRSADELWRQTASGHRNEINRGLRAGHRAFFDEGLAYLGTFGELYRGTMERLGAAEHYRFSDAYFRALRDALGPRLRLCLVEVEGEIAAGGLFVETGGLVQYHLSGSDPRFRRAQPTKLMLHFVREWGRARGLHRLHLGGGVGAGEDSLFQFKAGFAADRHPFETLRLVADERAYRELVRTHDPTADPEDRSGFFPLYRRAAAVTTR
jgi:CelD/BcsL family acetyltransferase involved in cellulose biosynthesis